jgi:hypothetical protein
MRIATILLLSLMFPSSTVSSIQLVSYSCDQTWLSRVPNASLDASFAFSGDGAHMAIGELEEGSLLFGPSYPNGTNNLIYITPQPVPEILFAPISPAPFGPFRIWMSATGYVIAAAMKEGGVQLFSPVTQKFEFEWKFPGTQEYNTLGVSGDGRFVPALVRNGTFNALYLLSAAYDNITWSYRFAPSIGNITSYQPVAISYDGARIATLVGESVFVFSSSRNQTLWSKLLDNPQFVFMSQDGNYLAIIENLDITVISVATGAIERTIPLGRTWGPGAITLPDQAFSFSNDGSTIAIIDGGTLKVWDRASGTLLFAKSGIDQIQVGSSTVSERPDSASMSQNGTIIAVGSGQRGVFVFDRSGNQLCKSYDGPSNYGVSVTVVKVSDDGKHVAAFAQDTAALFTITPQYIFLVLAGSAIAAATIILGYRGRKRLGKIRKRLGKLTGRLDKRRDRRESGGQRENPSGPFGPPHSTDPQ